MKFFFVTLLAFAFTVSLVSAAPDTSKAFQPIIDMASGLISGVIEAIKPLLEAVLGQSYDSSSSAANYFLLKILLAIVVLSICMSILPMVALFKDKKGVTWVISIVVSILSVRALTGEMINTIMVPNTALGMAIAAGLPFILYGIFVEKSITSSTLRRIAWIFFGVIFVMIYIMTIPLQGILGAIYPTVIGLAILMAFLDGTIRKFWNRIQAENVVAAGQGRIYIKLYNDTEGALTVVSRSGGIVSATMKPTLKGYLLEARRHKFYDIEAMIKPYESQL